MALRIDADLITDAVTLRFANALRGLLGPAAVPPNIEMARAAWEQAPAWPDALLGAGDMAMTLPEEPPEHCVTMQSIRTLDRPVTIRVLRPEKIDGVYVHLHGGGWATKRPAHYDRWNWRLARGCSVAVVSVDYRRSPEHAYPAGPDDCEAAALWAVTSGIDEFGTNRVVLGGDSSGASLVAVTLQRLRDRHGFDGVVAADLLYGMYDLSLTPSVHRSRDTRLGVSREVLDWLVDLYVPKHRRQEPDVSPLYGDLHNMPPALFSAGTLDPLLDDTLFMYARWRLAGCSARLMLYPGAMHNFDCLPLPLAEQCWQARMEFLREQLAARRS